MHFYSSKASEPEIRDVVVRLEGTGAAAPTKDLGQGVTATRTGAGVYKLTFREMLGTFVGIAGHCFGGSTPADLAGHTMVRDDYVAATYSIEVTVFDSAFAADDLEDNEYLDLTIRFKATSV